MKKIKDQLTLDTRHAEQAATEWGKEHGKNKQEKITGRGISGAKIKQKISKPGLDRRESGK